MRSTFRAATLGVGHLIRSSYQVAKQYSQIMTNPIIESYNNGAVGQVCHYGNSLVLKPINKATDIFIKSYFVFWLPRKFDWACEALLGWRPLNTTLDKIDEATNHKASATIAEIEVVGLNVMSTIYQSSPSIIPESVYDNIKPLRDFYQVLKVGHTNLDGSINWELTDTLFEAIAAQRLGINLFSCFGSVGEGANRVSNFLLKAPYIPSLKFETTDKAHLVLLNLGVRFVSALSDYHMFNRYSVHKFYINAKQNVRDTLEENQSQSVSEKDYNEASAQILAVVNNRLLNFSLQKNNCLKEFTKVFFMIKDALSNSQVLTTVSDGVLMYILFYVYEGVKESFDSGKTASIKSSRLDHKLKDNSLQTVLNEDKQIDADIYNYDLQLKIAFSSVLIVETLNTILFRNRLVFDIKALFQDNTYSQADDIKRLGADYDEQTKIIEFTSKNYLRVTEVFLLSTIINDQVLTRLQDMKNGNFSSFNFSTPNPQTQQTSMPEEELLKQLHSLTSEQRENFLRKASLSAAVQEHNPEDDCVVDMMGTCILQISVD